MIYELAKPEDIQAVYNVVQHTIKTIYPKYYPMEVVDFFSEHHSEDAIEKDIKNGYVSVLKIDGTIVATGCFVDDHITRAYVLPEHQKKGYGTFIMKNIEEQIGEKFDKAYLDALLPAAALYEKLGFVTVMYYWSVGKDITERRADSKWGNKFFQNMSMDMSDMIPNAKGFSPTNLRYMMRFYGLYKDIVIVPQVGERLLENNGNQIVPQVEED